MAVPLRLIIIGAGLGGLACAIACRRQGLEVLVLEKARELAPVGAGIQIPPNATRIWAEFKILGELRKAAVVSKGTCLKRWKDGEVLCTRTVGEAMDARFPWLIIHRADYQDVLVRQAEDLDVQVRLGAEVVGVDVDRTSVMLSSGEVISGDVVIGADGLWSHLRSQILGHESPPQPTGDLAYRGTFSLAALQALDDPAVDDLCKRKIVTMWIGPRSHAVFYPVKRGTEFNLVMTIPDDLPEHVRIAPGDLEEMKAAFEGWDPIFTTVLKAFSTILKWKMLHHDELPSWTKNHFALLGDACHPSLPYQAQGAALAVEDGAIIGTLLGLWQASRSRSAPRPSLSETLKLYENMQKQRTSTMHAGSIANQRLYHFDDGPEQEERDRILKEAKWELRSEGERERFIWIDVRYQMEMVGRDAIGEARARWEELMQRLN